MASARFEHLLAGTAVALALVNTRCSSRRVGSVASFATDSRPWAKENPARIDPESRFRVPGSWTWNTRRRFLRRRCNQATGRMAAATMRISARPGGKSMMPSSAITKTLEK